MFEVFFSLGFLCLIARGKQEMAKKNERWTKDQISALIEAYEEEPCLYATNSPHYHNKHFRSAALHRVNNAVLRLRPTTTVKECSTKFHGLRNQFNVEHSKVKNSLKSKIGTDNIYVPSLWYYKKLLFLDSHVASRKSRNSLEGEAAQSHSQSQAAMTDTTQEDYDTDEQFENIEYLEETTSETGRQKNIASNSLLEYSHIHTATPNRKRTLYSPSPSSSSSSSSSVTNGQTDDFVFRPPGPMNCQQSTSSTSGVCIPRTRKRKHARLESRAKEYTEAIQTIARTINEPINVNISGSQNSLPDSDVAFTTFLITLFRRFNNFQRKMEVMHHIMQIVMNALQIDQER